MNPNLIYPRAGDRETVYLKNVVNDPSIIVGDYTMYNDFAHDPREFAAKNVLYHYYVNRDRLIIGKYCSIACGAVPFQQREPLPPLAVDLPLPYLLRRVGAGRAARH